MRNLFMKKTLLWLFLRFDVFQIKTTSKTSERREKREKKSSFSGANKEPCVLNLFAFLFVYHTYLRDIFEHAHTKEGENRWDFPSNKSRFAQFLPIQTSRTSLQHTFAKGTERKNDFYPSQKYSGALKRINFYGKIFKWISNQTIDEGWWDKFCLFPSFHCFTFVTSSFQRFIFFSALWFAVFVEMKQNLAGNEFEENFLLEKKVLISFLEHKFMCFMSRTPSENFLNCYKESKCKSHYRKNAFRLALQYHNIIFLRSSCYIRKFFVRAENCKIIIIKHFEFSLNITIEKHFLNGRRNIFVANVFHSRLAN